MEIDVFIEWFEHSLAECVTVTGAVVGVAHILEEATRMALSDLGSGSTLLTLSIEVPLLALNISRCMRVRAGIILAVFR
jgi:hypothetical protein